MPHLFADPKIQAQESSVTLLPANDGPECDTTKGRRILHLLRQKCRVLVLDSWIPEVAALIFSCSCFITIFGILQAYNNKTPPQLSFGLSLNTVVSILSTASKSSLVYVVTSTVGQLKWIWFRKKSRQLQCLQFIDDASRGPLGSFLVLFQRPGRSLVSLGAIITLLALAFEPFMQQILRYPLRLVPQFTERALAKQVAVIRASTADGTFLNAVDTGFWVSDFEVTPACPSGNCTWPVFDSVGFCSRCEDVTSQAKLEYCRNVPFAGNITTTRGSDTPCNITLPYGRPSREPIRVRPLGDKALMELPTNFLWRASIWGRDGVSGDGTLRNELIAFTHAKLSTDNDHRKSYAHPEDGLRIDNVTKCTISFCSRQYNITVSNGLVSTHVSEPNWVQIFTHEYEIGVQGGELNHLEETVCWRSGPGGPDDLPRFWNGSEKYPQFVNESTHTICPDPFIYAEFAPAFTGSTTEYWLQDYNPNFFSFFDTGGEPSSNNVRKLISSGLGEVASNVAASLTKYFLDQTNKTVIGEMKLAESYVAVEWEWLVFPAAFVLFTWGLLVSTILMNKAEGLELWKSSILPLLYHGLKKTQSLAVLAWIPLVQWMK